MVNGMLRRIWMVGLVGLALAGCASVPMASAEDDARIKLLVPAPDAGLIYLYRNEIFGAAIHMEVTMDGRLAGATVAKSFMVWEVPPGVHTLMSHSEDESMITISVQPGGRYFVWQEVKMGLMSARSQLQQVPEAQGRQGVGACKLIEMELPRRGPPAVAGPPPVAPPPPGPPRS
jgi:hypothetical protein